MAQPLDPAPARLEGVGGGPYVIGIVAVLVVAGLSVMLWRLVVSQYAGARQEDGSRPRPVRPTRKPRRGPVLPPDDDPEFLAELARRTRPDDEAQ